MITLFLFAELLYLLLCFKVASIVDNYTNGNILISGGVFLMLLLLPITVFFDLYF